MKTRMREKRAVNLPLYLSDLKTDLNRWKSWSDGQTGDLEDARGVGSGAEEEEEGADEGRRCVKADKVADLL